MHNTQNILKLHLNRSVIATLAQQSHKFGNGAGNRRMAMTTDTCAGCISAIADVSCLIVSKWRPK